MTGKHSSRSFRSRWGSKIAWSIIITGWVILDYLIWKKRKMEGYSE